MANYVRNLKEHSNAKNLKNSTKRLYNRRTQMASKLEPKNKELENQVFDNVAKRNQMTGFKSKDFWQNKFELTQDFHSGS